MFARVLDAHALRLKGAAVGAAALLALSACGSDPQAGEEIQENLPTGEESQQNLSQGKLLSAEYMDGHKLREVPAEQAPSVELEVTEDSSSGWNVHVVSEDFEFAPERLGEVRPQEGHAHLFVDGEKVARLYGAWYHLSGSAVPAGEHELTVSLNANDHTIWAVDGEPIEATTKVTGTGESGHGHGSGHAGGHESDSGSKDGDSGHGDSSSGSAEGSSFVVSKGEVKGPRQLSAAVGEEVVFTVTADTADEVHVHGYDETFLVKPGQATTVRLKADIPGVFEVELEESGLQLTQLRVSA
jgi:hypothetical protein